MSTRKLARVLPLASALCMMPFLSGCMSGLFHLFLQSNDPRRPPQVVDVNVQSDPYGNATVNVSAPGVAVNAGGGPGGFGLNLGAPGVSLSAGGSFPPQIPPQYTGGQYPQYQGLPKGLPPTVQYPPIQGTPPPYQGTGAGPVLNPKGLPLAPSSSNLASGTGTTGSGQGVDLNIPDPATAVAELTAAAQSSGINLVTPGATATGTTNATGQPTAGALIQSRPLTPQDLSYDDVISTGTR